MRRAPRAMSSVKSARQLPATWCAVGLCTTSGGSGTARPSRSWRWCCSRSGAGGSSRRRTWAPAALTTPGIRPGTTCPRLTGGEVGPRPWRGGGRRPVAQARPAGRGGPLRARASLGVPDAPRRANLRSPAERLPGGAERVGDAKGAVLPTGRRPGKLGAGPGPGWGEGGFPGGRASRPEGPGGAGGGGGPASFGCAGGGGSRPPGRLPDRGVGGAAERCVAPPETL